MNPVIKDKISRLPGWLESQAIDLLSFLAYNQTLQGVTGDMMEIGVYKGKSASVLGYHLNDQETLHVCDTFRGYNDVESDFRQEFLDNYHSIVEGKTPVTIHAMESDKLAERYDPTNDAKFRIWHVDGLHSAEATYADLDLGRHLLIEEGGILIADDFLNQDWLGVNEGVNNFLNDYKDYCVVAQGYNKTIIVKKTDYEYYYNAIKDAFQTSPHNFLPFHGVKYLSLR